MNINRVTAAVLGVLFLGLAPAWAQQIANDPGSPRFVATNKKDLGRHVLARWEVLGGGTSVEMARKSALANAADVVATYMEEHAAGFGWRPGAEYGDQHLVAGKTTRLQEKDKMLDIGGRKTPIYYVSIPVEVTHTTYREMVQLNRDACSAGRMLMVGKVLGLVLASLVLFLGYLRVEEATKGYLTRYLGMGLTVLLLGGLVVAVLLW